VDPESIALARAVGEQVLLDEHRCFVDEGADNSEHVPRVARIAESVGRALFVEESMETLPDEDEAPAEAEALAELERCLREREG